MGQPYQPRGTEQQIISLGKILQNLRDEEDIEVLITTTVTYLRDNFDYQFIWFGFYDPVSKKLRGNGGITPDGDTKVLKKSILFTPGNVICQVITELCPVGVPNLRAEARAPEWKDIADQYNIQGTIFLPIRYKDKCLGVAVLGTQRWGYLLAGEARAKLLIVIGELGLVLEQLQQQQKSLDNPNNSVTESLLKLLDNIRSVNHLDQKLAAVVEATDQFLSPSRTSIYWFEREGNYFWSRMNSQLVNMSKDWSNKRTSAGITAQELSDVYYALAVNQMVWLSEYNSSLKSHIQEKLLQRLDVRSFLAAPIIWQKDLLGFIALESNEPRTWSQVDKNFIKGAAGLLSLVFPLNNVESSLRQVQQNHQLTGKFAHAVYQNQDLEIALHDCATELLERVCAKNFLILEYDHSQDIYQIVFQTALSNRRIWKFRPTALSEMDTYLLQEAKETIEIPSLEQDLRLFSWHSQLLENGVRSLLICNCIQNHQPEILMIVTQDSNRSWTNLQKEVCWVVSQCIGVIIKNKQLNVIGYQQQKIAQIFKQYPTLLIQSDTNTIESTALKHIADIIESPLAILLNWKPGEKQAKVIPATINNNQFSIDQDVPILVEEDVLIELALEHNSYLILNALDIPPETSKWLIIPENSRILVMALRATESFQPTAVVVFADYAGKNWSELKLSVFASLVSQLAWWQCQNKVTQKLTEKTELLQELNWYKHRRLQEIYRMSASVLTQIRNLGIPSNELTQMRYKLLLRQLSYVNNSMKGVVQQEQWQLHLSWETMTINSLLKRSIERVDHLAKQQQLWIGVHGLTDPMQDIEINQNNASGETNRDNSSNSSLATAGDIIKIELVIYELLVNACKRSPVGDRVDIWCRPLNDQILEISITDNGKIAPRLLVELSQETEYKLQDLLNSKTIHQPPGLHLFICQKIIKQLGGTLQIYQSSDNRIVNRLTLPLAVHNSEGQTFGNTSPLSQ